MNSGGTTAGQNCPTRIWPRKGLNAYRTRREFKELLGEFQSSEYRYLHLSCHANEAAMVTTFDTISFPELGNILRPHLTKRRLFVSACEMVNEDLAIELFRESGLYSVVGPAGEVDFDEAAVFWAAFYLLIFNVNTNEMKGKNIRTELKNLSSLLKVPLNYAHRASKKKSGYKFNEIHPGVQLELDSG